MAWLFVPSSVYDDMQNNAVKPSKTLVVMEREKSWETITATGMENLKPWELMGRQHCIELEFWGLLALAGFTVKSSDSLAYKTLITQETWLGYLAANCIYASIARTPEVLEGYFHALEPIFALIKQCEDGRDVMSLLKGQCATPGSSD